MRNRFQAFNSRSPSMCRQALLAICVLLAVPSIAPSQWRRLMNPLIPVSIEHPPKYVLSADKIIFAPAVGACGDDITSELIEGFAERESELLGPEDLRPDPQGARPRSSQRLLPRQGCSARRGPACRT